MAENKLDLAAGVIPLGAGPAADFMSAAAAESNEALAAGMKEDCRQIGAAQARFVVRLAECTKREMFRADGATSPEVWVAERFGVSGPTARSFSVVADKAPGLPHLVGSLGAGDISFDKVRAVVDVASPESDRELCDQAKEHSVRELVEVARNAAERARSAFASPSRSQHDSRYLRFNDGHRTMSLQVPSEEYARTKACVDAWAAAVEGVGDTETESDEAKTDGAKTDGAKTGRSRTRRTRRPRPLWTSAAVTGSWPWWTRRLRAVGIVVEGARRIRAPHPSRSSWWPMCPSTPWWRSQARRVSWQGSSSITV